MEDHGAPNSKCHGKNAVGGIELINFTKRIENNLDQVSHISFYYPF